MKHELMKLPFAYEALEPYMSKETLEYHHDKHHQTYVTKLNELVVGTEFEDLGLTKIILKADGPIFNNAAQIFNHDFFWKSISPVETTMSADLTQRIVKSFGSVEAFKTEFLTKAATHFGSGWIWLVVDKDGDLKIVGTANANTPLTDNFFPLLTCDVWEHAYYIDYRNVRVNYLDNWWKIVNWEFVSSELAKRDALGPTYNISDCNDNSDVCNYVESIVEKERAKS